MKDNASAKIDEVLDNIKHMTNKEIEDFIESFSKDELKFTLMLCIYYIRENFRNPWTTSQ